MTYPYQDAPEWQSQSHLTTFANFSRRPSQSSQRSVSPTAMLGAIKSSFRRKNSNSSTVSRESRESREMSPRDISPSPRSSRGPVELAAGLSTLNVNGQQMAHPHPLRNPSPATRRPDRPGMNAFTVPSNEPPPAYTPSPTTASGPTLGPSPPYSVPAQVVLPSQSTRSGATQREDPYAFLSTFDTILLIDDSGSMAGRSWRETSQALSQLLPIIVERDADGIDIYFLNHISTDPGSTKDGIAAGGYRNVKDIAEVQRIFQTVRPGGGTPTGTRIRAILRPYLAKLDAEAKSGSTDDVKPLNVLTITDGVPSDDVESVVINAAKKLDALDAAPHQIGIQFFQVGNEEGAAEALRDLDDGLVGMVDGGVRDIVDTCTWMGGPSEDGAPKLTSDGILKVCLGSVIRRLDRRGTHSRS